MPGSVTSTFALNRFDYYGVTGKEVQPVSDYSSLLRGMYDAVISFEVLEHLPQPAKAVKDMARMLKPQGVCLVTESFGSVHQGLPTHLGANIKFAGWTPLLFLKNKLVVSWYSRDPLFKPMEFERVEKRSVNHGFRLVGDKTLVWGWLLARARGAKRSLSWRLDRGGGFDGALSQHYRE